MGGTSFPRALRTALTASALLGVGYSAIALTSSDDAQAQAAQSLPAMTIDQPIRRTPRRRFEAPRQEATPVRRLLQRTAPRLVRRAPPQLATAPAAAPPGPVIAADTQEARTGTVGVYSNSTAVATKTN